MDTQRDIDRLYQLPLGDFTGARNALAKAAGQSGAGIKALEKPAAAAWAVNQLYWKQRRTYDKLIRASDRIRAGHAHVLKGKKIDLRALETLHGAAVKDAAEHVRAMLNSAGDPATSGTMKSVVDTLQALPGGGAPGRLTKPLAPIGFGAFGALMKGAATSKALADVVTFAPPKPRPDEIAAAARARQEAAARRLGELEREAKKTRTALAAARARLERAAQARAEAETRLQKTVDEAKGLAADVTRLERDARAADQDRAQLAADGSRTK